MTPDAPRSHSSEIMNYETKPWVHHHGILKHVYDVLSLIGYSGFKYKSLRIEALI